MKSLFVTILGAFIVASVSVKADSGDGLNGATAPREFRATGFRVVGGPLPQGFEDVGIIGAFQTENSGVRFIKSILNTTNPELLRSECNYKITFTIDEVAFRPINIKSLEEIACDTPIQSEVR